METFKDKVIKVLSEHKDESPEVIATEIEKIANPDNIIGCFSVKEVGEAYTLGRTHQTKLKEGEEGWSTNDIIRIWSKADMLQKTIFFD